MEAHGHRAFSGTCDRLTSAGRQPKSGLASCLVVREDNCGVEVRGTKWAIIGSSYLYLIVRRHALPRKSC
ncbi:hypothetical protein FOXYSP1_14300 [Fusarium oxysporum f. sp. phaseoli]